MATAKDGSPFDCEECTETDQQTRNCFNRKGLSDGARAVTGFTEDIVEEHKDKGAGKVFRLADIRLYECPLSYLSTDTADLMRLVYLVDGSNHLYCRAGWAGQPCWLVEAYEIYKNERVRHMEKARDD